jgi:hypothetical protein
MMVNSYDTVSENRAVLRPCPFDADPLVVSFPARLVANRAYGPGGFSRRVL